MAKQTESQRYHEFPRPGKIAVQATKPCVTQRDLSLAYTPGVADVCLEIAKNANDAFRYTARGNLVAVISNGTAVLGLGDIGPLASKPVMEGKGVLFKRFADIDVFDIELDEKDPEKIIAIVKALEPTFGGINLEDIAAPACFEIESRLIEAMDIPVFHDDQHGTAIITTAALINALDIQEKKAKDVRVVVSGAGAAATACAKLFLELGVRRENMLMTDSKGVVRTSRTDLNKYKQEFAVDTDKETLSDAMAGADIFLGVSKAGLVTGEMVKSMADKPIVFALANPDPEISYEDAVAARDDLIMATGRSDYPNQVNNVLGFPFIFRGALDVNARRINTQMKLAAAHALADLAKETVPEQVMKAYGDKPLAYGPDYIIPKPFDSRVLLWVAPAVARGAVETGVARKPIQDFEAYRNQLERILGPTQELVRLQAAKVQGKDRRVVFADGDEEAVLKACEILLAENIARPIVLGRKHHIEKMLDTLGLHLEGLEILDQLSDESFDRYCNEYWLLHQRQGYTRHRAYKRMRQRNHYGAMMVRDGRADVFVGGFSRNYYATLDTAIEVFGTEKSGTLPVGVTLAMLGREIYVLADTGVHYDPTPVQLAHITRHAADTARRLGLTPRVALLSFANFGAVRHSRPQTAAEAVRLLYREGVDFEVDGEMSLDVALQPEYREKHYPFARLCGRANVLVFPDLNSAAIASQMTNQLANGELLGPMVLGLGKPTVILNNRVSASEIVNLTTLTLAHNSS